MNQSAVQCSAPYNTFNLDVRVLQCNVECNSVYQELLKMPCFKVKRQSVRGEVVSVLRFSSRHSNTVKIFLRKVQSLYVLNYFGA